LRAKRRNVDQRRDSVPLGPLQQQQQLRVGYAGHAFALLNLQQRRAQHAYCQRQALRRDVGVQRTDAQILGRAKIERLFQSKDLTGIEPIRLLAFTLFTLFLLLPAFMLFMLFKLFTLFTLFTLLRAHVCSSLVCFFLSAFFSLALV
jgi:hypothetical protein